MNENNGARQLPNVLSMPFHFHMLLHKGLNKKSLYFITNEANKLPKGKKEAIMY